MKSSNPKLLILIFDQLSWESDSWFQHGLKKYDHRYRIIARLMGLMALLDCISKNSGKNIPKPQIDSHWTFWTLSKKAIYFIHLAMLIRHFIIHWDRFSCFFFAVTLTSLSSMIILGFSSPTWTCSIDTGTSSSNKPTALSVHMARSRATLTLGESLCESALYNSFKWAANLSFKPASESP